MATFRPMTIETDAANMACLYNYTVPESITADTAFEGWTLREGEIRATMQAVNRRLGYIPEPGFYTLLCALKREENRHALSS